MKTLVYAHRPDGDLQFDLTRPDPKANLHRALVLIHGGGWVGSSRAEMTEIGNVLATKGFLIVSPDYRLAPKHLWPAQLEDVQSAVRYVRSHAKELDIDSTKIGASGISAGGHLSAFLASTDTGQERDYKGVSSRVQAAGCISSIDDLNLPLTPEGEGYRIVQRLLGETDKPNKSARAKASPINYFDKTTAPILFIQGKADTLVPAKQTDVAFEKLKALAVPTEAIYVEGMGHGLNPSTYAEAQALDALADWMKKYLGG